MNSIWDTIYDRTSELQGHTWQWFNGLSREEWLVVLAITFASGFVALLGFQSRRL
jgi:hypothetical protein